MTVLFAVMLDYILGDPKGFPHPVIYIGKLIGFYEKFFYRFKNKKLWGFIFAFCVLTTVGLVVWGILKICSFDEILFNTVNIFILYTALSCKSLKDESRKVIDALEQEDLAAARKYLSHIVGRDTQNLNKGQIISAVIETIAENTIDGVIAVLFYMIGGYFLGIPALLAYLYKAASTLDSMVGYKNKRYLQFGYASAKLDDVLNFIPARFGSLVMLLSGAISGSNAKEGFRIFKRDRKNHSSLNSAHSESVIAGLLGVRLGGGNYYFGEYVSKPYIGDDKKEVETKDMEKVYNILDLSVMILSGIFITGVILL